MPRFLADENFPGPSIRLIQAAGYEVVRVADVARRSPDVPVLARSTDEGVVLLTQDAVYGELAFLRGLPAPSGVVHFRLKSLPPTEHAVRLLDLLERHGATLEGKYTVIKPGHTRQRPLS